MGNNESYGHAVALFVEALCYKPCYTTSAPVYIYIEKFLDDWVGSVPGTNEAEEQGSVKAKLLY
jgi:hypothetical protein